MGTPGSESTNSASGHPAVDGVDGHDIACEIDGFGAMQLRSSVVRTG